MVSVHKRSNSRFLLVASYHAPSPRRLSPSLPLYLTLASQQLHDNAGPVPDCAPDISGDLPAPGASPDDAEYDRFSIPSLADLGVEPLAKALKFRGGEREALARLERVMVSDDHDKEVKAVQRNKRSLICAAASVAGTR